jgi:hypothetical protein
VKDFQLHCAGCGQLMSYNNAWRGGLVKTLVCGKECHNKVETDYVNAIILQKTDAPCQEKK